MFQLRCRITLEIFFSINNLGVGKALIFIAVVNFIVVSRKITLTDTVSKTMKYLAENIRRMVR